MNALKMHCRLCNAKIKYGDNIFRKPKLKYTYAKDLLELFKIQLKEKRQWPSNACSECVEFIVQMKRFKETVSSTQDLLEPKAEVETKPKVEPKAKLEPEPEPEPEETVYESHFADADADTDDDRTFVKVKEEDAETEVIDLPPTPPTRKTTRSRKPRELDPETVASYEDSDDDREVRRMERRARIQEELDRPFGEVPVKKGRWGVKKEAEESKSKVDTKFKTGALLDYKLKALDLLNCHLCQEKQESFEELCNHMRAEHKIQKHLGYVSCCKNRFNLYTVYDHANYHENNDLFKCETCNKKCLSTYHLRKHSLARHRPADAPCKHKCSKCQRGFHVKADWLKHERKHKIYKFDCDQCKGMFVTHEQLQDHINFEHENIPRHICDICGKGFKTPLSLQGHIKQHTVPKTVQPCDICGLFFIDLKLHQRRKHTPVEPQQCPDCGKTLSDKYMKRHRAVVHGGGKKNNCTICGREFNNKDKLKVHMDIHLGIRYNCHFCSETYGSYSNRLKHMQRKHPVEYANYRVENNHQWATKYNVVGSVSTGSVPVAEEELVMEEVSPGNAQEFVHGE